MKKPLVWFITGTSRGFGWELVRAALERGDSVIATSRTPETVRHDFKDAEDRLLSLSLDFSSFTQIESVVEEAIARFGRIDVLVNNAGYGLLGAIEEASDAEIASIYEVNVFGLLRVTRAVLPHLRKQRSGHIVNLSSMAGLAGNEGYGIYSATKFAVEGLSEALAKEVKPLGIHVTIVEPGPFRTDFLGEALKTVKHTIADYDQTAGRTRLALLAAHGKQIGDPVLGVQAIIKAVTAIKPPLHLLLGRIAYECAQEKLNQLRDEFTVWEEVSLASDFKEAKRGS